MSEAFDAQAELKLRPSKERRETAHANGTRLARGRIKPQGSGTRRCATGKVMGCIGNVDSVGAGV